MAKDSRKKLVALVGRPNVGKSTLFNVLVGARKALVEDTPGLTRDRNYAEASVSGKAFTVVDTGGFEPVTDDVLLSQMRTQTMVAIEQADIIIFLGDGKAGVTPSDEEIVRVLAETRKKVFYAVNKIDSEKRHDFAVDFYSLGVEPIYPVSALTGYGLSDLLDALAAELPESDAATAVSPLETMTKVAVVGRPNVGKSTFINLLLGAERLVANPQPGTTTDSIDTIVRHHGKDYLFIDTAGIRRRARVVDRMEKYSVIKAFQSIDRADIVVLLMDATEPVTDQDVRIAGYAFEKGRGLILVLNKWDLVKKDSRSHDIYVDRVREGLKYVAYAPILTMSAFKGTRAVKIFGLIDEIDRKYRTRVTTGELNRMVERIVESHPPGMHRSRRRIKIYYATQVRTGPPTFAFFCNYPESVHFSYRRFLENRIREEFDFGGSPLRLIFRKTHGREPQGPPGARKHG
ncbi:MAG: ribosome biogenesis GTPase Der [Desulfomonile sp.]|nr:ribosome biogenesis GTPase Der [Desulfomonile sp.]